MAEISAPNMEDFSLEAVEVRLARPDERVKWDALVRENHYLEFKRFAGRGLRYVVACRGRWLALAGWQTGAFKCRPRGIGWKPANQFRRLRANNTRFVSLAKQSMCRNLASLAQMLNRLSDDWQARHRLLLAETFVDPSRFEGTIYKAGGWIHVGDSKGYSRWSVHGTARCAQTALRPFGATRSAFCAPMNYPRSGNGRGPFRGKSLANFVLFASRKSSTFAGRKGGNIPQRRSSASTCLPGWPGSVDRWPPPTTRSR